MSHTRPIAVVLATGLLATAGCGSSHKAPSRAGFIASADAICRSSNAERESIALEKPPNYGQMAAVERTAFTKLQALEPPAAMARRWRELLAVDQALVRYLDAYAGYEATANTRGARGALYAGNALERVMTPAAKRDGFVDCAQFG